MFKEDLYALFLEMARSLCSGFKLSLSQLYPCHCWEASDFILGVELIHGRAAAAVAALGCKGTVLLR